jgi:hypothetical protein
MGRSIQIVAAAVAAALLGAGSIACAQGASAPVTPRSAAQIDLTGYWVSLVTEDWRYRMADPPAGDFGSIPLNRNAYEAMRKWSPPSAEEKTPACSDQFGAPAIMRQPGRLHIEWQGDTALRIDVESGGQPRVLKFADFLPPGGFATSEAPAALASFHESPDSKSLQGTSIAAWTKQDQSFGFELFGRTGTRPPTPARGGSLMVVTSGLLPGLLQKNGVPYSENTVMKEFFDVLSLPDSRQLLIVTTVIEDPQYLVEPDITSTQFLRETSAANWAPTSCKE